MNNHPLHIYVLWHPDFEEGQAYGQQIYSAFYRNINYPLKRGIGIPVYFRSAIYQQNQPREIDFQSSANTAIVVLVNVDMIIDDNWKAYVTTLQAQVNKQGKGRKIIYPVAITNKDFKLGFSQKNFIRLFQETNVQRKGIFLINRIAHELCRFLYNKKRIDESSDILQQSPAPIKLFLSHAKMDGEDFAITLRNHINNNFSLKTFFDANDIAYGYDFYEEIKVNIEQAAFLAIYSDKYSSSQWCIKEIILAKKYNRPIIIVNSLNTIEERSFPYMGNVRNIRCDINKNDLHDLDNIIYEMMLETLRVKFTELYLRYLTTVFGKSFEHESYYVYPPELFSITNNKNNAIIYPDPPLSADEINILKSFNDQKEYITPMMLPII